MCRRRVQRKERFDGWDVGAITSDVINVRREGVRWMKKVERTTDVITYQKEKPRDTVVISLAGFILYQTVPLEGFVRKHSKEILSLFFTSVSDIFSSATSCCLLWITDRFSCYKRISHIHQRDFAILCFFCLVLDTAITYTTTILVNSAICRNSSKFRFHPIRFNFDTSDKMRNIYGQENLEWLNDVNLVSNVDSYSKTRVM